MLLKHLQHSPELAHENTAWDCIVFMVLSEVHFVLWLATAKLVHHSERRCKMLWIHLVLFLDVICV